MKTGQRLLLGLGLGLAIAGGASATDMGTAFTYQGFLEFNVGGPVTNTAPGCNFEFELWDALAAGAQVDGTQAVPGVSVDGGVFTVVLDFGSGAFNGQARWLNIKVCCPSPGCVLDPLDPRVELTPAPHALALPAVWITPDDDAGFTLGGNVIGGHHDNTVAAGVGSSVIAGGGGLVAETSGPNEVTGSWCVIGGGDFNVAGPTNNNTISGGYGNTASGGWTSIGGGDLNIASGPEATIAGGRENKAGGDHAAIGGGFDNETTAVRATIGGGRENIVTGGSATIGGGSANSASDNFATIGGGVFNEAGDLDGDPLTAPYATVGGGRNNKATFIWSTVGGGSFNSAGHSGATIAGGGDNRSAGAFASIGGGYYNSAGYFATVGGGDYNYAGHYGSTIAGGRNNRSTGSRATIGGGYYNSAGYNATVGGGRSNIASNTYSSVGGGYDNTASGFGSSVGGGLYNYATNSYTTVGGGYFNHATNYWSTVPGGSGNTASGKYSFASGRSATSSADGTFSWLDSSGMAFDNAVTDQFIARAVGGFALYTDVAMTVWASLPTGSGAWVAMSDRNRKANFFPVSGREVLARLMEIPIETWNYKSQDAAIRHIGPMAQDFSKAFGVGRDDMGISTIDSDGVALAAIQGLHEMIQERDATIGRLEARLTALEKAAGVSVPVRVADAAELAPQDTSLHPESWDSQARFSLASVQHNPFLQASQQADQEIVEPQQRPVGDGRRSFGNRRSVEGSPAPMGLQAREARGTIDAIFESSPEAARARVPARIATLQQEREQRKADRGGEEWVRARIQARLEALRELREEREAGQRVEE